MEPLQQGDCWHCGLFSLINAGRLLGSESEAARNLLYQFAEEVLSRPLGRWEAVSPELMSRLLPLWQAEFAPARFLPLDPPDETGLARALTQRTPVLAGMAEPGVELHWTLVREIRQRRLLLWDSSGRAGYDPGQWRIASRPDEEGATLHPGLLFALHRG